MAHSSAVTAPSHVDDVVQAKGLMDKGFLMKLAQYTLISHESFQLGVFLKMKTSQIEDLARASDDIVIHTFKIFETWVDSRNRVGNATALFNQLGKACVSIKRADMVDFVRCEQLHLLEERWSRAKRTAQSCKTKSNEQMKLVKVELRQVNDELELTREELRKSNDEVQHLNELVTSNRNQIKTTAALSRVRSNTPYCASMAPDHLADRIKALKAAAKAVDGESDRDIKLRALHVMSMLRGYGQPELWGQVSQHFVNEGQLDLSEVLSSTNLPDLLHLLQSGAASDVFGLYLNYNAVFADEEAGRTLGDALAKMSELSLLSVAACSLTDKSFTHIITGISRGCQQLQELYLDGNSVFAEEEVGRDLGAALAKMSQLCGLHMFECSVTDMSWAYIADGITRGCHQLEQLDCRYSYLTDGGGSENTMVQVLTDLPDLKIWAWECGLVQPSIDRLQEEFPDRFYPQGEEEEVEEVEGVEEEVEEVEEEEYEEDEEGVSSL